MTTGVPAARLRGALVAALLAGAAYLPSLRNGFAYDDVVVVQADDRVHSLQHVGEIFATGYWKDPELSLYRPLTTLSFAVDWTLAQDSPAWFHFTNLLWNALATALVFLLLAEFFPPAAAFLGAALFAVHPVHVEAVANVVGRAELLAAVFFLAACLLWVRAPAGRFGVRRTLGLVLLFILAILSKEGAVTLPGALLLLDLATGRLRRGGWRGYLSDRGLPFLALALVFLTYLGLREAVLGELAPTRLDPALEMTGTPSARILTALQAWPEYVRLLFFPRTLLADYGPRIIDPATHITGRVLLGVVILGATLWFGVLALATGRRRATLALLWFPITIAPVSNLVVPIGVVVAERTLYLPSFALAFAAAGGAAVAATAGVVAARTARAVAVLVGVLFLVRVETRIPTWKSTDSVFLTLVRERPDAFRAQWHLARMARRGDNRTAARDRYLEALRLWPYRKGLVVEAANYAAQIGQLGLARQLATRVTRLWPREIRGWRLLAGAALDLGDTTAARAALQQGLLLAPSDDMLRRMQKAIGATAPPGSS